MAENMQLRFLTTPQAHDVLSGRGNLVNRHPGNVYFRSLVKKHKEEYLACPKSHKAMYSTLIYDEIRSLNPPGRFLKQDPDTKLWSDIGKKKALAKTRQALREGAPELLRDLQAVEQTRDKKASFSINNLARAPHAGNSDTDSCISIEPSYQIKTSLSRFLPRTSSVDSMGAESLLSLGSMNVGRKNDASALSGILYDQESSDFGAVPCCDTWISSRSQSGEGTSTWQACRVAKQMNVTDQPADQWQNSSNMQRMISNLSTQAPKLQLQVHTLHPGNTDGNEQQNFNGKNSRTGTYQFTNIIDTVNYPSVNFAASSHQQDFHVNYASLDQLTCSSGALFANSAVSSCRHHCNLNNKISCNDNQVAHKSHTKNATFVNSSSPYHQQQCAINTSLSGNDDISVNHSICSSANEKASFVNCNKKSTLQQQCLTTNNTSGNVNAASVSLLSILSSSSSYSNVFQADVQLSQSQLAYQQNPQLNFQQNAVSKAENQGRGTQVPNVRAKSA